MSHGEATDAQGVTTGTTESHPTPPPPPADDQNPAIIDGRKTFILTIISSVLFIGAVLAYVL